MFTSFFLARNAPGLESLFWVTLAIFAAYSIGCIAHRYGRTVQAIKRAAIGLVLVEIMTELVYYLGFMKFFPGYEIVDEVGRLYPTILLPVIYAVCSWGFICILNSILYKLGR